MNERPKGKNKLKGVAPKVALYKASVKVLGKTYSATGTTISDAIAHLDTGKNCKGRAILTLSKGEKSKDRILMPFHAMRLFNTMGMTREVNLKRVSTLFDGFDN